MIVLSDSRKIGIGLTLFGIFFLVLGVMLFFDKGLLAMGNILFLGGDVLLIGPAKTYRFFFQWRKAKGTAAFLGGIVLVFVGWVKIGMIIEVFGFFNLFGDFFPVIFAFLRSVPVVGTLFRQPLVKRLTGGSEPNLPF